MEPYEKNSPYEYLITFDTVESKLLSNEYSPKILPSVEIVTVLSVEPFDLWISR